MLGWFVYMVRCADGTLYTGATNRLGHRIRRHNEGRGAKYTRSRLPVVLVWSKPAGGKSEALREEARVKRLPKARKEELVTWRVTEATRHVNPLLDEHMRICPPLPEGLTKAQRVIMSLHMLPDCEALAARIGLCQRFAWATPTEAALEAVLSRGPVVEMGAGGGYWAMLMRVLGGDVVAYDRAVGTDVNPWNPSGFQWTQVLRGGPEALRDQSDRTLFLCWPPDGSPMASECLDHWGGTSLAYVGNPPTTGDEEFHERLERDFEVVGRVAIPQWMAIEDGLVLLERK